MIKTIIKFFSRFFRDRENNDTKPDNHFAHSLTNHKFREPTVVTDLGIIKRKEPLNTDWFDAAKDLPYPEDAESDKSETVDILREYYGRRAKLTNCYYHFGYKEWLTANGVSIPGRITHWQ